MGRTMCSMVAPFRPVHSGSAESVWWRYTAHIVNTRKLLRNNKFQMMQIISTNKSPKFRMMCAQTNLARPRLKPSLDGDLTCLTIYDLDDFYCGRPQSARWTSAGWLIDQFTKLFKPSIVLQLILSNLLILLKLLVLETCLFFVCDRSGSMECV